jgi:hypothetical protein
MFQEVEYLSRKCKAQVQPLVLTKKQKQKQNQKNPAVFVVVDEQLIVKLYNLRD